MSGQVYNGPVTTPGDVTDLFDVEAEKSFLGFLLLHPEATALYHDIEPRTFFRDDHRVIFRACLAAGQTPKHEDGEGFSAVSEELRRYLSPEEYNRLFGLCTGMLAVSVTEDAVDAAAKHLANLYISRKVLHLGGQIASAAYTIQDPVRLRGHVDALRDFAFKGSPQPTVAESPAKQKVTLYTTTELYKMELPPVKEVVPGLYGASHYLLSGAPKMGKSFLAMSLATALGSGTYALGKIAVDKRHVLYLSLEDGLRRTVVRLQRRLQEMSDLPLIDFAFSWPSLDDGGLDEIERWLDSHSEGVVFIDTGKRIRQGSEDTSRSFYESDYDFIAPLTDIYHQHDTMGLTLWHDRKLMAEDFFDQVNSSRGLTAAVDGVSQLHRQRGSKEAKLSIGDRDTEDRAFKLTWDEMLLGWLLVEKVDVATERQSGAALVLSTIRRLQSDDMGVSADMVAAETGLPKGSVKNHFVTLRQQGVITDLKRGFVHTTEEEDDDAS